MNSLKHLLLLAASSLLASCASPYVAPPSESAARLRIAVPQSETFASVVARAYPSGQCESPMSLGMIGGIARLSDEKSIGIPGHNEFSSGTSIERLIPSGSPYMVSLRGIYSGKICTISFRVTPSRGEDYEAVYSWGGGSCYVSLNKVTASGTGEVKRSKVLSAEQASACTKGFS